MQRPDAKRCSDMETRYPKLSEAIPTLRLADPTEHLCTYLDWICKSYLRKEFLLEDVGMLREDLNLFHKNKMRFPPNRRDINAFTYPQLKVYLDETLRKDVSIDEVFLEDINKKVLYSGPLGTLIVPLTHKGSMEVGSGTRWCTAGKTCDLFDEYSNQGPLYVWIDKQYKLRKGKSKKYQFHFESEQFMDEKDIPLDSELLTFYRTEHPIISALFRKYEESLKTNPEKIVLYCQYIGRIPSLEPYLVSPADKFLYAKLVLLGRWDNKEIERSLLMEMDISTAEYLVLIGITLNFDMLIDDGVITGEEADSILISMLEGNNKVQRIYYSRGKEVPELEPYVKNARIEIIITYIMTSRLRRWSEVEHRLLEEVRDTRVIMYACQYIGSRWLELESEILRLYAQSTTLRTSTVPFHYACLCMNRRWIELEELYGKHPSVKLNRHYSGFLGKYIKRFITSHNPNMMNVSYLDPYLSYMYSVYALKCSWKEAIKLYPINKDIDFESVIYSVPEYGIKYISKFIHKRVPEYEKLITTRSWCIIEAIEYVRDIVGSKDAIKELNDIYSTNIDYYTAMYDVPASPEQEKLWLKEVDEYTTGLVNYSIKFKKDRWPELEDILVGTDSSGLLKYCIHYGRISKFEKDIKKDYIAIDYARLVMFEEWPEAEKYIVDNQISHMPYLRMNIAKYIKCTRRRPWPEIKTYILKYPMEAVEYAKIFIKGEWKEANKIIGSSYESRYEYSKHVLKGELPLDIGYVVNTDKDIEYYWKYLDYIKSM